MSNKPKTTELALWLAHYLCLALLLALFCLVYRWAGNDWFPAAYAGRDYAAAGLGGGALAESEYRHVLALLRLLKAAGGVLTAGLVASFLAVAAFTRREERRMDRVWAEVILGAEAILSLVMRVAVAELQYGFHSRVLVDLVTGLVLFTFAYALMAGCLLSLLRRLMRGQLIDSFLCVRAVFALQTSFENRSDRIRSGARGLNLLVFLVVNAALALAAGAQFADGREKLALCLFLALLALDAWYLMKICQRSAQLKQIFERIAAMASGDVGEHVDTSAMRGDIRRMAETVNALENSLEKAVSERTSSERMKTDLIANVSHDLRTPLTSIINYVDLLKRENIPNPRVQEYLSVLESKSMRMKSLAEALMEASRAASGNLKITWATIDMVQMVQQVYGEFQERMEEKKLIPLVRLVDPPAYIRADGQILWRVLDNLYTNVCKYGRPGTQVLIELQETAHSLVYTMKNVSAVPLRYTSDELMERFTRGEDSRTTEGSGLGLSIARSMTEQLGGKFELYSDEEMFRVRLIFPLLEGSDPEA